MFLRRVFSEDERQTAIFNAMYSEYSKSNKKRFPKDFNPSGFYEEEYLILTNIEDIKGFLILHHEREQKGVNIVALHIRNVSSEEEYTILHRDILLTLKKLFSEVYISTTDEFNFISKVFDLKPVYIKYRL